MNRPAIDDLLDGLLSRWFETVAEWMPPGQPTADTCASCRSSLVAGVVPVGEWPHELIHLLATNLESMTVQAYESLTSQSTWDGIREYIVAKVRLQAADMQDMLVECVEPRIEAWVQLEVARGLDTADFQS